MSFEDAGDLASFAAIAESATANREGKIKRVKTATDFDNWLSSKPTLASLGDRDGEHFVIVFGVSHS